MHVCGVCVCVCVHVMCVHKANSVHKGHVRCTYVWLKQGIILELQYNMKLHAAASSECGWSVILCRFMITLLLWAKIAAACLF